jgi:GTP-binding protein EngB required for normal cell division
VTLARHRLDTHRPKGGVLPALARLARDVESPAVAAAADALARRVEEGRFHVACVGQFKRGKSTLINALLGDPILPASVRPVTSVVTVVRHGEARSARVFSSAGSFIDVPPAALGDYVSEAGNPDNRRGVRMVEVFHPAPLLASGLCLVDTPGLGSVFDANSAVTREFVPHIDAAIAVVGADPPISGEELSLLSSIAGQTSHLLIVLNKADRIPEGDRAEAVAFAREVLQQRLGRRPGYIFEVSALEKLRDDTSSEDWDSIVEELRTLAAESGVALVRAAEERGASLLAGRLLNEIDGKRRALERPLAETAERLERLREALDEAARSTRDLGPLLAAELERFRLRFTEERDRFLAEVLPAAEQELLTGMEGETTGGSELGRLGAERARRVAQVLAGAAKSVTGDHMDRQLPGKLDEGCL